MKDVTLTGREKPGRANSVRVSRISREYECNVCGHVGWSKHIDLELLVNHG